MYARTANEKNIKYRDTKNQIKAFEESANNYYHYFK